jgi:membrane associated rhomboid family serine protease
MIRWKSVKTWLILVNASLYLYEVILTILKLKRNYPAYWPDRATEMVIDSVWGTVLGPLATSFGFSAALSKSQPYRALTSGFTHDGMVHLLINMAVLQQQPSWLETGLGTPLYLSTFLWSIIGGNTMHLLQCATTWDRTLCLGASSAVCGLYGLLYVCMVRMRSGRGSGNILGGMAILSLSGLWLDNVSMAANAGGFLCGMVTGFLCGPRYMKDYSMRRKNSVGFDPFSRDYRLAMGFGITPTNRGIVPISLVWIGLLILGLASPSVRTAPLLVWKKLLHPMY